jgi:hypothetical protein
MKLKLFILSFAGSLLFLSSCKKEFLELKPYDQVSLDVAITNESDMQTALNGAYASLRTSDLFNRTLPLVGDLMADNVSIAIENSNRYGNELNYNYLSTSENPLGVWTAAYSSILALNNIINSEVPSTAATMQMKGEALTMRALLYFYLVRLYGQPFTVDPNAAGVPIVLEYDPALKPARSKVSEVYTQIDKDLTDAFNSMTTTDGNSSYVTKYAARALQAKVAMTKGDWATAKTAALDVVTNGGYSLAPASQYLAYWANPVPGTNKVETIFEISSDAVNNGGNTSLPYFYDQNGYGDAFAVDALYNLYSPTDVRKGWMIPTDRGGQSIYAVNKYPNTNNPSDKDDIKIIRYAEVLLIFAESYARTGDEANALVRLNQVAKQRDPAFAGYTSTGQALIDNIILERRKELAFEGDRYWDLARLKQNIVRINLNNNYPSNTPLTLPASSPKRIWPIPQDEVDANDNIVQNPGY